jgi:hypothetical protein
MKIADDWQKREGNGKVPIKVRHSVENWKENGNRNIGVEGQNHAPSRRGGEEGSESGGGQAGGMRESRRRES